MPTASGFVPRASPDDRPHGMPTVVLSSSADGGGRAEGPSPPNEGNKKKTLTGSPAKPAVVPKYWSPKGRTTAAGPVKPIPFSGGSGATTPQQDSAESAGNVHPAAVALKPGEHARIGTPQLCD